MTPFDVDRDAFVSAGLAADVLMFVFPKTGHVEGVFVLSDGAFLWELRSAEAAAWFEHLRLADFGAESLEAVLCEWCEFVPRVFRPIVLGVSTGAAEAAPVH